MNNEWQPGYIRDICDPNNPNLVKEWVEASWNMIFYFKLLTGERCRNCGGPMVQVRNEECNSYRGADERSGMYAVCAKDVITD